MKTAAVLLAEGAEEMETVISVDVLRRGGVWFFFVADYFQIKKINVIHVWKSYITFYTV